IVVHEEYGRGPRLHCAGSFDIWKVASGSNDVRVPVVRLRGGSINPDAGRDPSCSRRIHPDFSLRADDDRTRRLHRLLTRASRSRPALREGVTPCASRSPPSKGGDFRSSRVSPSWRGTARSAGGFFSYGSANTKIFAALPGFNSGVSESADEATS